MNFPSEKELQAVAKYPEVIRAVADYHGLCALEAGSVGPEFSGSAKHHEEREKELNDLAYEIEKEWY